MSAYNNNNTDNYNYYRVNLRKVTVIRKPDILLTQNSGKYIHVTCTFDC